MIRVLFVAIALLAFGASPAYADLAAAKMDSDLGSEFARRCNNALDVGNWGGASVFCQSAAEHFGNVADDESMERSVAEHARTSAAEYLILAARAYASGGSKDGARQKLAFARGILTRVQDTRKRSELRSYIAALVRNAHL
jgi:hypothetical protein